MSQLYPLPLSDSFWGKYKNYIVLGSISVIVFGVIGYFIYKKLKGGTKGDKIDCQLSDWMYTDCICDSGSSSGYIYKTKNIIKESQNGGTSCPSSGDLRQVVRMCNCSPSGTPTPSLIPSGTPTGSTNPIYGNWISEIDTNNEIIINNNNTMLWKTSYNSYQNYLYDPISGKYCFNNKDIDCSPNYEKNTFKLSNDNINQAINTTIMGGYTTILKYKRKV